MNDAKAVQRSIDYLAAPFLGFVMLDRLLHASDTIDSLKVVEQNAGDVDRLRKEGRSFIVALGHFFRPACLPMYLQKITPFPIVASVNPLPGFSLSPSKMRIRLQYGQMLRILQYSRPDINFLFASSGVSAARKLVSHFKNGSANAIITADAFWSNHGDHGFTRAFAGHNHHRFATGAATLGRLAQCPVIPCAPYLRDDGTIVVEWGPLISPPGRQDKECDIPNTNVVLDFFEKAIGRRPHQYLLYIGYDRQWNASTELWEDVS